jgi:hypothetical protein
MKLDLKEIEEELDEMSIFANKIGAKKSAVDLRAASRLLSATRKRI